MSEIPWPIVLPLFTLSQYKTFLNKTATIKNNIYVLATYKVTFFLLFTAIDLRKNDQKRLMNKKRFAPTNFSSLPNQWPRHKEDFRHITLHKKSHWLFVAFFQFHIYLVENKTNYAIVSTAVSWKDILDFRCSYDNSICDLNSQTRIFD